MISGNGTSRRDFLKTGTAVAATAALPYWFTAKPALAFPSPNERLVLGCIGTGGRWRGDGPAAMKFAHCVAICDVDSVRLDMAEKVVKKAQPKGGKIARYEDYQQILDDKNIDIVTICTPDHWHVKIGIEAMKAGKDVYCEKPLTLTIKEGQQISQVVRETGRVFQVGTQQRSGYHRKFLKAIALIREGRLGKIENIDCSIGGVAPCDHIAAVDPPKTLNWEKWQGQTPLHDFRFEDDGKGGNPTLSRCHWAFRWWFEYSGGNMTDWGAHHVDIAQWMIEQNGDGQGASKVEPVMAVLENPPDKNGNPTHEDRYNVANKYHVRATFPDDVTINIKSEGRQGILVTGTKGRIFVNRGDLEGKPVEDLEKNPLPEEAIAKVYGGHAPHPEENGMNSTDVHMHNFIDCVASRKQPISDVFSHHRALTTCHLGNIAMRLDRTLKWDPKTEEILNDPQARAMQSREQRAGYEIRI